MTRLAAAGIGLLLAASLPSIASADYGFSGRVTNEQTGATVPWAAVFAIDRFNNTHTVYADANGNFSFDDLPSDGYKVFARSNDLWGEAEEPVILIVDQQVQVEITVTAR